LIDVMLSVIILSVFILSVIMANVVAPKIPVEEKFVLPKNVETTKESSNH
jgi:hypothetical protein